MPRKMIQPLPAGLGATPTARFNQFTKALLTVLKTEIETPEQEMARLESDKRKIEREIAALKKRNRKR
jgi:hypothetical protein